MTCPSASGPISSSTAAIQDTWNPTWTTGGCVTKASALLAQPWVFQAVDQDLVSDDPICQTSQLQFTEANFAAGGWSGPGLGGLQTLTVELQPQ